MSKEFFQLDQSIILEFVLIGQTLVNGLLELVKPQDQLKQE